MLGSLEKRILSVLRKKKVTTARGIQQVLNQNGMTTTYVTVNTVLSRMCKKGLVARKKEPFRGKFRYTYEYLEVEDRLMEDLVGDVDLLFGEEGLDHLKIRLEDRKLVTTDKISPPQIDSVPLSIPEPQTNMRITLSRHIAKSPLIKKIEDISGQNVQACYQCGKCSAGCPMVQLMDLLPNQIIRLVQLGQINDVLRSKTIWLCASCFSCTVRCPKGVDLAKVMEALRLLLLRKSANYIEPSEIDVDENLPQIALVSNFRKMTG